MFSRGIGSMTRRTLAAAARVSGTTVARSGASRGTVRAFSRSAVMSAPRAARAAPSAAALAPSRSAMARRAGVAAALVAGTGVALVSADETVDYDAVRAAIAESLEDESHDDGSLGPILVRLAWHASGTYDKNDGTGGSQGATMRFSPEAFHGANAGLSLARNVMEKIKRQFPGITYADLWTLAGVVAIEEMGGPKIEWSPGRVDYKPGQVAPTPGDRLPDAAKGADHVREVFQRMGFTDQETVALIGAHALGRCHTDRSGFSGPWTFSPTTFSNDFFQQLLNNKWTRKSWDGPLQYEDPTGALMMLPSDMALVRDPEFAKWVKVYADNEELFFEDFAKAFGKLIALGTDGCNCPFDKSVGIGLGVALVLVGGFLGYSHFASAPAAPAANTNN